MGREHDEHQHGVSHRDRRRKEGLRREDMRDRDSGSRDAESRERYHNKRRRRSRSTDQEGDHHVDSSKHRQSRERQRQNSSRKRRWGPQHVENTGDVADEPCTRKAVAERGDIRERAERDGEGEGEEEEEEESEPLPVTLFKDELMRAVRSSQVLVCTGETGSGKTTQIPQYLLELVLEQDPDSNEKEPAEEAGAAEDLRGRSKRRLQVAVTQPRRVAATSVARRVADERGCRLGEEVGYSIRFEDRTGPNTRIKYMTDGVLVRECLEDPCLSRYGVVMLDEAHERSIDTDILFGLLKRALTKRPDLRAVITSATLDVERFAAFFGNCPFVSVPGRTHEVDVYHSKTRQVRRRMHCFGGVGVRRTSYVRQAMQPNLRTVSLGRHDIGTVLL